MAGKTWKTFQYPQDLEALVFEGVGETRRGSDRKIAKNKDKRLVKKLGSLSDDLTERVKENLQIILDLE